MKSHEEEIEERQQLKRLKQFRDFKEELRPCGGGDGLSAGVQGQVRGHGVSGNPGMPGFVTDEIGLVERDRERGQAWYAEGLRTGLLPAASCQEGHGAGPERAVEHRYSSRPHPRCADPTLCGNLA